MSYAFGFYLFAEVPLKLASLLRLAGLILFLIYELKVACFLSFSRLSDADLS